MNSVVVKRRKLPNGCCTKQHETNCSSEMINYIYYSSFLAAYCNILGDIQIQSYTSEVCVRVWGGGGVFRFCMKSMGKRGVGLHLCNIALLHFFFFFFFFLGGFWGGGGGGGSQLNLKQFK